MTQFRIITKNKLTSGSIPPISSLLVGELALNTGDGGLYYLHNSGTLSGSVQLIRAGFADSASVSISSSFASTASFAVSASWAPSVGGGSGIFASSSLSSSWASSSLSSSYAESASWTPGSANSNFASSSLSSSWASSSLSSSYAETSSYALNGGSSTSYYTNNYTLLGGSLRTSSSLTINSFTSGATETGSVTLANGFVVYKLQTSHISRVRLYSSASYRDADITRPVTTSPSGEHGLILDVVTSGNVNFLNYDLAPPPFGADLSTTPNASISYTITNLTTSTINYSSSFVYVPIEVTSSAGSVVSSSYAVSSSWSPPVGRSIVSVITPSLASNATYTSSLHIGKTFMLITVAVDRDARIRLYGSQSYQQSDVTRSIGVDPTSPEPGIIADLVLSGSSNLYTFNVSPLINGSNLDATPTASIYYSVTNLSGASSTVSMSFTRLVLE